MKSSRSKTHTLSASLYAQPPYEQSSSLLWVCIGTQTRYPTSNSIFPQSRHHLDQNNAQIY